MTGLTSIVSAAPLILVVDDDRSVRDLLRRGIEAMGHVVQDAADAHAALRVLEQREVALVLCDMSMPGNDGVWLVDQIAMRFPGVPIVLATGLVDIDPRTVIRPCVVGQITKPFTFEPLEGLIKTAEEWRAKHRSPS
jgi:DNA-binding NtrC family response regulator